MDFAKNSKITLAAVKPRNWRAPGLSISVSRVAMSPVTTAVPNFLVHHNAKTKEITANISHIKGVRVNCQKIGVTVMLRIAHKAAQIDITATSRELK